MANANTFKLSNTIKDKLNNNTPVFGLTITVNSVEVAVQAADAGFDFIWLEMEHSPISLETARNIVLATRGLEIIPFARVPVNEIWTAKRVLDAGVLGVIFPFTSTQELAKQSVNACRYPPVGKRGSGASLASFRWSTPEDYYDFADENILVVAIIEEVLAVENIDQIVSVSGVDVIFIGLSDLSFSLGLRGELKHPKLDAAVDVIAAAAKKQQKVLGTIVGNPEDAQHFIDKGFLFFQTVSELELMKSGAKEFLSPLGKKFKAKESSKMNY